MSVTYSRKLFLLKYLTPFSKRLSFSSTQKCSVFMRYDEKFSLYFRTSVIRFSHYENAHKHSAVVKDTAYGSKYCPPSVLEITEERMRELCFQKFSFTFGEWDNFRTELTTSFLNLTDVNFDSVLMNVLLSLNNFKLAESFMEYLKHIKRKPNFVTCLKYMALCSRNMDVCKEDTILKVYDSVKTYVDVPPVLDNMSVDCLVQGLCATYEWRKAFVYLKKLPLNNPGLEAKNSLVCALLRNCDVTQAWKILDSWYNLGTQPGTQVFKEYLKLVNRVHLRNAGQAEDLMDRLFKYLLSKEVVIKASLAQDISDYFRRKKWNVQFSRVDRSGVCSGCKKTLAVSELTDSEFEYLKKSFYEKAVKKFDVYINTTENELRRFLRYIESRKPFDLVLDGLNAAHISNVKGKRLLAQQLLDVVELLSASSEKILILGRNHMNSWPRNTMEKIQRKAFLFFMSNESQDDPFLIYAALASGPNTKFVSSDLMRDHMSRLESPKLIQLFKHWQLSHQVYLSIDENGTKFTDPLKHQIRIQGNMKVGWHIPYDDEFVLDPYEELNNWLCLKCARQHL